MRETYVGVSGTWMTGGRAAGGLAMASGWKTNIDSPREVEVEVD